MNIADILWYFLLVIFVSVPVLWKVDFRFRFGVKIAVFYLCIIGAAIFSIPVLIFRPFNYNNYSIVGWIFLKLTAWTKVRWEIRGSEHFEKDQSCVIMCNHQSSIDLMGMMEVLPDRCVSLIKRELLYAGPFGISATLSGSIFVDRFNTESALKLMKAAVEKVIDSKLKLWIFPEGTRYHEKGMLPFKKGGFHLAVQAKIPVVPVVFSCYDPFYSKKEKRFLSNGFVIVKILPPISTENLTKNDVTRLSEETREKMLETFHVISLEAEQRYKIGEF